MSDFGGPTSKAGGHPVMTRGIAQIKSEWQWSSESEFFTAKECRNDLPCG